MLSIQRNTAALSPGKLYKLKIWKKKNKNFFLCREAIPTSTDRDELRKRSRKTDQGRKLDEDRHWQRDKQTRTHTESVLVLQKNWVAPLTFDFGLGVSMMACLTRYFLAQNSRSHSRSRLRVVVFMPEIRERWWGEKVEKISGLREKRKKIVISNFRSANFERKAEANMYSISSVS